MTAESTAPSVPPAAGQRLLSLDALRGFDMFWITGGKPLFLAILTLIIGGEIPPWFARLMTHPEWNGISFWDLIFPLFLFMVGVAMPFSFAKYLERGEPTGRLYWRICRRTLLLILLGLVANNGLLKFDLAHMRFPSVLGRIGLAYFFASLITLHSSTRGRVAWIVVLLVGYWAALMWIPVPHFGAGNLQPGKTLTDYVDRSLMSGHLYHGVRDPEGPFGTIPSIATALLGVLAGQWLRDPRRKAYAKTAGLAVAGLVCVGLGYLWGLNFPINKNLWSSSYVLWAGGWSLLLLSLFYLIIDVWNWRKWSFFFVVIGVNAITIYVAQYFVNFYSIGKLVFGNAPIHAAILMPAATVAAGWLFLYILYRNRIFLRL